MPDGVRLLDLPILSRTDERVAGDAHAELEKPLRLANSVRLQFGYGLHADQRRDVLTAAGR